MATNANQDRFAYDFERPVVEIERELRQLAQQAGSDGHDLTVRIERLERKRDRLLQKMTTSLTAYQRVRLARHPLRPHPMDYVRAIFTNLIELHGDRRFGNDPAIVTALAQLDDHSVMVIALQKGREMREKLAANFGMPQPEGYRKALHKMRLAEKFGLPLVCFIDSPGAAPTIGAEERGQGMAIAENICAMAGLGVPIVVVVTGEGCSGGALAIGVGDRFAMQENAYYGVITPEGLSSILWRDGDHAEQAAEAMKLTANDMLAQGIIDTVIPEPLGGAHRDPQRAAREVERFLTQALDELKEIPIEQLLEDRYRRYRRIGVFEMPEPEPAPVQDQPEEP